MFATVHPITQLPLPIDRTLDITPKSLPLRSVRTAARIFALLLGIGLLFQFGCGTTTKRTGTEQLLISDAVDKAVDRIDFSPLQGVKVYLDSRYISALRTKLLIDSNYVTSSIRQQLTAAGALVQEDREQATVIVEPRVGALGADGHDVTYGIPQSGAISSAVNVVSGSTIPTIPEISLGRTDAQSGVAKLVVFAYDRESRAPIWQSGLAKAESTSSSTWILGAGPFQKGTIHEGVRFAGREIERIHLPQIHPSSTAKVETFIPHELHYDQAFLFTPDPGGKESEKIRQAELDEATVKKVGDDEPSVTR